MTNCKLTKCKETLCSQWEIQFVTFTNVFRLKFGIKDTLLCLENEHCLKMISVDSTINGSVSDVTGGLNSIIMDISLAFYHFKRVYLCKY